MDEIPLRHRLYQLPFHDMEVVVEDQDTVNDKVFRFSKLWMIKV